MEPIHLPLHRLEIEDMVGVTMSKGRKSLLMLSCGSGLITGLVLYAFVVRPDDPIRPVFCLTAGVVTTVICWLGFRYQYRRVYRRPGQSAMFGERTVNLDDAGVRFDYLSGVQTSGPWSAILKSEWTDKLLLLYLTDSQFLMIPRRVLGLAQEQAIRTKLIESGKTR